MTHRDPVDVGIPTVPRTVAELPFFAAGRFPKPDFIGQCRGDQIRYISARELVEQVRDLSLGLRALGMSAGDRIALLSESRPEWLLADFAVLTAGAVTTPIYTTLSASQVAFILRDSGASMVFVSNATQLDKILAVASTVPSLRTIVLIDAAGPAPASPGDVQVVSFAAVKELGHRRILDGWGVAREFQDLARQVRPEDSATIIYTSGTTGEPKGVMLTHHNLVSNLEGALGVLDLNHEDVALSFLPLCHAFERLVAYVYFCTGVSMSFAESIDTISRDLRTVRPTVMSGVPRVFEKLYARIQEKGRANTGLKRWLFEWAMGQARRAGHRVEAGQPWRTSKGLAWSLANRLVFSQIHAGLGGRLRYAVSGSAPLDPAITRFFFGLNLPILEGYGLTETSPVVAVMPLNDVRLGTVGPPLRNVDLRVADDGELLVRGPNVMLGYYNRPDETATVIQDGWFHTGDIGQVDERGYIRITDRKKELIVTSGGKKIAPQPIEQKLRAHPLIAEAVLIGDRRNFPAALLIPDLSAVVKIIGGSVDALRGRPDSPELRDLLQQAIDQVNRDLAQFERIKKFAVVLDELTVDNGALTPTLKVKRRVMEERYREVIESIYS